MIGFKLALVLKSENVKTFAVLHFYIFLNLNGMKMNILTIYLFLVVLFQTDQNVLVSGM